MASFSNYKSTVVTESNTAAGVSAGVTVYSTRANLPSSGNSEGDQAYVTENNRLYIWNGSGWYNIALINLAPSIQSVLDSDGGTTPFSLATDGTSTTITITANDSDGDPLTYTAEADSDFTGLATISQADNVFTVTPFSEDSATTTSGTITFKADDGVNIASSAAQTFTLTFSADWSTLPSTETTTVEADDDVSGDEFGQYGLALGHDGNSMLVGARRHNGNLGAVYAFTNSGGTWTQRQKITSGEGGSLFFGLSIAISGDTAIIGDTGNNKTKIYVTSNNGESWSLQQTITTTDSSRVAIDGDTAVIASYVEDKVYIYTRSGTTWSLQQTLSDPDTGTFTNRFGFSVDISGDILALSSEIYPATSDNFGRVYVYTRSGSTWTLQQRIDPTVNNSNQYFGEKIALDGNTLAIGFLNSYEKVDVYTTSDGGSNWSLQQAIPSPVSASGFGRTLALTGDALAIGALLEDNPSDDEGAVYVYVRDGTTWTQVADILNSDSSNDHRFGQTVDILGSRVVVGTWSDAYDKIYVFEAS
jgi:hypothetical protein